MFFIKYKIKKKIIIIYVHKFIIYLLSIVPFEEDERDPSVWYLDHNYHESMYEMFKKVNGRYFVLLLFYILTRYNYNNKI